MTVTNTSTVKSFSSFLAYMVEAPSHNGVDPRYVMTMTRGPMSLGSARSDFTRLMAGTNRSVQAVMTLHSAAPGELETIARHVEGELGLAHGSMEPHDGPVIERYMKLVEWAEDASAPNTAGIYAAQVDGESGLLHVHGMRVNTMLADTEVAVRRRVNQRDNAGKLVRDAKGLPVPVLDDKGKVVYENTVEIVKAGQALPPSMRDALRSRRKVDEVWLSYGIDNEAVVTKNRERGTVKDRVRELLVEVENERTDAMTVEQVVEAIRAKGHDAHTRGKKRLRLTVTHVDPSTKARRPVRLQQFEQDEPSFTTEAFLARMATAPEPVIAVEQPAVEPIEQPIVEHESDLFARMLKTRAKREALGRTKTPMQRQMEADAANERAEREALRDEMRAQLREHDEDDWDDADDDWDDELSADDLDEPTDEPQPDPTPTPTPTTEEPVVETTVEAIDDEMTETTVAPPAPAPKRAPEPETVEPEIDYATELSTRSKIDSEWNRAIDKREERLKTADKQRKRGERAKTRYVANVLLEDAEEAEAWVKGFDAAYREGRERKAKNLQASIQQAREEAIEWKDSYEGGGVGTKYGTSAMG